MDIEFDTAKDAANIAKHGVSLALAVTIFENLVGVMQDDRQDYGEARFNVFGMVAGRLYVCTYTPRGDAFRIISVRKAHKKEQQKWLS